MAPQALSPDIYSWHNGPFRSVSLIREGRDGGAKRAEIDNVSQLPKCLSILGILLKTFWHCLFIRIHYSLMLLCLLSRRFVEGTHGHVAPSRPIEAYAIQIIVINDCEHSPSCKKHATRF